jgi:hypothetical protein
MSLTAGGETDGSAAGNAEGAEEGAKVGLDDAGSNFAGEEGAGAVL